MVNLLSLNYDYTDSIKTDYCDLTPDYSASSETITAIPYNDYWDLSPNYGDVLIVVIALSTSL